MQRDKTGRESLRARITRLRRRLTAYVADKSTIAATIFKIVGPWWDGTTDGERMKMNKSAKSNQRCHRELFGAAIRMRL